MGNISILSILSGNISVLGGVLTVYLPAADQVIKLGGALGHIPGDDTKDSEQTNCDQIAFQIMDELKETFNEVVDETHETLNEVVHETKETLNEVVNETQETFNEVVNETQEAFNDVVQTICDFDDSQTEINKSGFKSPEVEIPNQDLVKNL